MRKIALIAGLSSILVLILFIIVSCEYQTDEIFYNDLDKDVALPDLQIDLNLSSDTVYVYSNYTEVKFSLSLTNKDLYDVKFYINEIEVEYVYRTNDYNFYFIVDMSEFSTAKVKAEIYTSTETNSVADIAGSEYFLFETEEWTLIKCNENLEITTSVENGRLKIAWTPVRSSLRNKYTIYTSDYRDSTYNNWYIDSNYVGGKMDISITFNDNNASGFYVDREIDYEYQDMYINNRDSFLISWDKPTFYNNIKGYGLVIDDDTIELNTNDTSFVYTNGFFGKFTKVQLFLFSNKFDPYDFYIDTQFEHYPLDFLLKYPSLDRSCFPLNGSHFYYYSHYSKGLYAHKFDVESKKIKYSTNISIQNLSVSPNDVYITESENDYLKIYNNKLEEVKRILKTKITPDGSFWKVPISDNGLIAVYDYSKKGFVFYDILSESIISEIPVSSINGSPIISPSGKYLFDYKSSTLYKIEGSSYSIIQSDSRSFSFYEFAPYTNEQIALFDGSEFFLKNCENYNTIVSFSLNGSTIRNIDYENKKILTYKENTYYIYSLKDGNILDTIEGYFTNQSYLFYNHIITSECQYNLN